MLKYIVTPVKNRFEVVMSKKYATAVYVQAKLLDLHGVNAVYLQDEGRADIMVEVCPSVRLDGVELEVLNEQIAAICEEIIRATLTAIKELAMIRYKIVSDKIDGLYSIPRIKVWVPKENGEVIKTKIEVLFGLNYVFIKYEMMTDALIEVIGSNRLTADAIQVLKEQIAAICEAVIAL